jgi:DNA polymerase-1
MNNKLQGTVKQLILRKRLTNVSLVFSPPFTVEGDEIVVAMGDDALRALGFPANSVNKVRGLVKEKNGLKIGATYNPVMYLKDHDYYQTVVDDLVKYWKIENGLLSINKIDPEYIVIDDNNFWGFIENYKNAEVVVYDIETTGLDFINDTILFLALTIKYKDGSVKNYILPNKLHFSSIFPHIPTENYNPNVVFVAHNGKFDNKFLRKILGYSPRLDFDTMLASYALDERQGIHSLEEVAKRYLAVDEWKTIDYKTTDMEAFYKYAATDTYVTYLLYETLSAELEKEPTLKNLFYNILMPGSHVLEELEYNGIKIDIDLCQKLIEEHEAQIADIVSKLQQITGNPDFNPNSNPQVVDFLYNKLKLEPINKEKNADKNVLMHYKDIEFCSLLLQYRKLSKTLSTYLKPILEKALKDPEHRLHTNFNLHRTVTGRLSSSEPNLQNITRGSTLRGLFITKPEYKLIQADFSQAELRTLAALSGDKYLIEVYQQDRDLHSEAAAELFGENYTKEHRTLCKRINFGVAYGMTANALLADETLKQELSFELTEQFANEVINKIKKRMPVATKWLENQGIIAYQKGYIETIFGRRRRFPYITTENYKTISRQACNFPIQSTASDLTLLSLIELNKRLKQGNYMAQIVLTVHDSILIECHHTQVEEVRKLVEEVMIEVPARYIKEVPFKADSSVGDNWGEL